MSDGRGSAAGASDRSRGPTALALGILALALALRTWGIDFGLPYDLTPDEPHHILQALKIGAGDGGVALRIWHTVGKQGLDYILFFEYGVLYAVWRVLGYVSGPDDFARAYLEDPTAFYLIGRLTVAVMGALTCWVVYLLGRRLYGAYVGLGAAFIGATAYVHAVDSHVINVHVPMALALWAGVYLYVRYEERPRRMLLVSAGLLAGAAVALAYTAAIGVLATMAAIATAGSAPGGPRATLARLATYGLSALAIVALMSPDLIVGAGALLANFSQFLGSSPAPAGHVVSDIRQEIDAVTILREQEWLGYVRVLTQDLNLLMTLGALVGMAVGCYRRERWTIILTGTTLVFLLIVSASDRDAAERYLFPVLPALWLACSRGLGALTAGRAYLFAFAVAVTSAQSAVRLVQRDQLWTRPDTRVLAKTWIEDNVAENARILMDGMRFRFVQSPPLNPNAEAVERRLTALGESELRFGGKTLRLYEQSMRNLEGPKYDLHSTVYGLQVRDLDWYVENCFDYVVISSDNEEKYLDEATRARHPRSAAFYQGIRRHPRYELVFSALPRIWEISGPDIHVYRIDGQPPRCADPG